MRGAVQFSIDRRGLIITVVTNALVFPGNSATLLSEGRQILAVIAPPLVKAPNDIEVDGHTNQENVSTDPYPSGWELSSARASAVVRFLIGGDVAPSRLSAVGFSDQHPLYPPSDPRSITLNRRVEIVVLSSLPASAGDAIQAAGSDK
jgi:chemotaxis protein MotB